MYVLVDQVGLGSRIIFDRSLMSKIGVAETGTQVVEVEIEDGALVIRSVRPEARAAALASAETARDDRERRRDEAIRARMPRPIHVRPMPGMDPEEG